MLAIITSVLGCVPTKANGYVARNRTIPSTEPVAMRHHHSVYLPETSAPSQTGETLGFIEI
jgi:hypothetical protein